MKSIVALICLAVVVSGEAPIERTAVYYIQAPRLVEDVRVVEEVNAEQVSEDIMAKLKQIDGSDSGIYHVYLPDGRLQRVQYTTAPLNTNEQLKKEQDEQKKSYTPVYKGVKTVPLPTAGASNDEEQSQTESREYKEAPKQSGYVASITYSDVTPIQGPVYAYNAKPLVRTVRYAPRFF